MNIPISETSLRFGKLPPKIDYRTLNFENYVKEDIPEPPPEVKLVERVCLNLKQPNPSILFPMDANDTLGDCTIAGAAHGITIYNGMVHRTHIPNAQNMVRLYFHLSGGSDSGLYMADVIRYWRSPGIDGEKIYAYVNVNKHNRVHVKQAMSLFGGLYVGFQCQEKVMEEFKARKPWQPGRLINAGHAIYVTGYDDNGVDVLTWGTTQRGTWAWWEACVDECYALLPPEAQLPEFTPGFDFARLKKDLAEVAII